MLAIKIVFGNFFILVIAGIIIYLFLVRSGKRKQNAGEKNLPTGNQLFSTASEGKPGMQDSLSIPVPPGPAGNTETPDEKVFDGSTGGISWKMVTTLLNRGSHSGRTSNLWNSESIWTTTDVRFPDGKFLLIMSTPSEIRTGEFKMTGFFNKLLVFAVEKVLDFYVGGYFGIQYTTLVRINEQSNVIPLEDMKDFFILSNDPEGAKKFLDEGTRHAITGWKHQDMGFRQEAQVDQFGVLFAPDAMIVGCQTALRDPGEVKRFSDFACAMAVKMKGTI